MQAQFKRTLEMTSTSSASLQSRPYRSHRVPACIRCRSRKIRCHIDIPGEPCLSCRERRLKCRYTDESLSPRESQSQASTKRRRPIIAIEDEVDAGHHRVEPLLHRPSNNASASIILAPHIAEDVDIVQRHMLQHRNKTFSRGADPYRTINQDVDNPIIYLTVPRFRTGLPSEVGAGKEQLEIIEQLMGPFKNQIVELYFKHMHPSLPIMDAHTCSLLKRGDVASLSKALVCVVNAIGVPFWSRSDTLKMHPKPDIHYIWNKAISALGEDFRSPSISTVCTAVLDQIGRPSVSIIGNITLCGETVSLAQTFGLHRDPSQWNITEDEKSTRVRIWWGVLISDYWTSIAYGVLPHSRKRFYDVPLPTVESLLPQRPSADERYATTCFVHLCGLTEFLGEILPLVYQITPDLEQLSQSVTKLTAELNNLERQLPEWLPLPHKPGSSNLWFCFLSMRLLLSRVALRAAILDGDQNREALRLEDVRKSSAAVLDFVLYLGEYQFLDFWLPYATQMLVHAVTVDLRCSVEAKDAVIRNTSVARLTRVMDHIRHARDAYEWDIAEYCLERCSDIVAKIADVTNSSSTNGSAHSIVTSDNNALETMPRIEPPPPQPPMHFPDAISNDTQPQYPASQSLQPQINLLEDSGVPLSDLLDPNAFDLSWEALWDTPSGMMNFSI